MVADPATKEEKTPAECWFELIQVYIPRIQLALQFTGAVSFAYLLYLAILDQNFFTGTPYLHLSLRCRCLSYGDDYVSEQTGTRHSFPKAVFYTAGVHLLYSLATTFRRHAERPLLQLLRSHS